MPLAVLQNGEIRPLEPLPANWHEGQRLRVETTDDDDATPEEIDRDFALLAKLCADSDPVDEERLSQRSRTLGGKRRTRSASKWGCVNGCLSARLQSSFRSPAKGIAAARPNPPGT